MSVAARSCGLGRCGARTRDLSLSLFGHIAVGSGSRFFCTNRTLKCKVISPTRAVSLPLISVRSRSHIRSFAGSRALSHKEGASGMEAHLAIRAQTAPPLNGSVEFGALVPEFGHLRAPGSRIRPGRWQNFGFYVIFVISSFITKVDLPRVSITRHRRCPGIRGSLRAR